MFKKQAKDFLSMADRLETFLPLVHSANPLKTGQGPPSFALFAGLSCSGSPKALIVTRRKQASNASKNGFR